MKTSMYLKVGQKHAATYDWNVWSRKLRYSGLISGARGLSGGFISVAAGGLISVACGGSGGLIWVGGPRVISNIWKRPF